MDEEEQEAYNAAKIEQIIEINADKTCAICLQLEEDHHTSMACIICHVKKKRLGFSKIHASEEVKDCVCCKQCL